MNPFDILEKPLRLDIIKARPVMPVGTIKEINGVKYQKTNDGWRYVKDPRAAKREEEAKNQRQPKQEEQGKERQPGQEEVQSTIKPGHEVTGAGGVTGKVTEVENGKAKIETKVGGEKKEYEVSVSQLEKQKQEGNIQHNANSTTLKDHHKKMVEDMHADGKSSSSIVSALKNAGVDEDEAMEHVVDYKRSKKEKDANIEKKEDTSKDGSEHKVGDEVMYNGKKHTIKETSKAQDGREVYHLHDEKGEPIKEGGVKKFVDKSSISKDGDEEHEDHDNSIDHQAKNETNHEGYLESLKNINTNTKKGLAEATNILQENSSEQFSTEQAPVEKPTPKVEMDANTKRIAEHFGTYEDNISNVINNTKQHLMVGYGAGGVGKTYNMLKALKDSGKKPFIEGVHEPGDDDYDYKVINGKVTAAGLYQLISEHPDKILVFDDCDSIFDDDVALNILKNVTDTGGGERGTNWATAKPPKNDVTGEPLPKRVDFTGKILITTNKPLEEMSKKNPDVDALFTRGPLMDASLNDEDSVTWISHLAKNPKTGKLDNFKFDDAGYTEDEMKTAIDFLKNNFKNLKQRPSTRIVTGMINTLQGARVKSGELDPIKALTNTFLKKSNIKKATSNFDIIKNRLDFTYGKVSTLESQIESPSPNYQPTSIYHKGIREN